MKFSEKTKEEQRRFSDFLISQAANQSRNGREVLESTSRAVLLANTGGVVVISSFLASGFSGSGLIYMKISVLIFSLSVAFFLIIRFRLLLKIGSSVKSVKQFHLSALEDNEDISDGAVNDKLFSISKGLEGSEPVLSLGISLLVFIIGILLAAVGIFL